MDVLLSLIHIYSVYAGVPARKVKEITPEQREEIILRIARDYRMYASWYEEGK